MERLLNDMGNFFGLGQDELMYYMGILNKADKPNKDGKPKKEKPGVILPMRGFLEEQFPVGTLAKGIRDKLPPIADNLLREIERKNPIISAIVNTRVRQMRPFSRFTSDETRPGFRIKLIDADKSPTKAEQKEMEEIAKFFTNTGKTDFEGWDVRDDTLHTIMSKSAREFLTIDKVAIELRRDKRDKIVDFWMLDAATIKRVTRYGGFKGNKGDFDPRIYVSQDELSKKLEEARMELIPDDVSKIRFIQELEGHLVAAFEPRDLLLEIMQERVDVRYNGHGYSPTEQAIGVVTSFLFAMAYNSEAFNSGAIPKIGLAMEEGGFSEEQLQELQDEWIANFRGIGGAWRIPVFNGKANVIDLWRSPREMEYSKYLEFTGALICAVFGIDSAELGLRFQQAQNVLSENLNYKQEFSKDRGLKDLLGKQEDMFNKIMRLCGWDEKYMFEFTGLEPVDPEGNLRIVGMDVKTRKTVNEIRAENDLEPDPYGDIILDPTYLQYRMQKEQSEQAAQGGGEEGFDLGGAEEGADEGATEGAPAGEGEDTGEDAGGFTDEDMEDVMGKFGKAATKITARTMLI